MSDVVLSNEFGIINIITLCEEPLRREYGWRKQQKRH